MPKFLRCLAPASGVAAASLLTVALVSAPMGAALAAPETLPSGSTVATSPSSVSSTFRGGMTIGLRLPIVTDLIQESVATYAQGPGSAFIDLDGESAAAGYGYVMTMPVLRATTNRARTVGGVLFVNVEQQKLLSLSNINVQQNTKTVSALVMSATAGYLARVDVFTYDKSQPLRNGFSTTDLRLLPGVAALLNENLGTTVFTEGMLIGSLDLVVKKARR